MHDPLREAQPSPSDGCTPKAGLGTRQAKYRTGGDPRARGETEAPLDTLSNAAAGDFRRLAAPKQRHATGKR